MESRQVQAKSAGIECTLSKLYGCPLEGRTHHDEIIAHERWALTLVALLHVAQARTKRTSLKTQGTKTPDVGRSGTNNTMRCMLAYWLQPLGDVHVKRSHIQLKREEGTHTKKGV